MSIYKKLLDIQKEIKSVSKDGKIETSKGTYKILSHGRVMELTRSLFIDKGLIFYPEKYEIRKDGAVTTVTADYRLVDTETDEVITVASVGQGSDTQDKGAGKASTYADKYLVLRLLRLIQEDDPDLTSSENMDEKLNEIQMEAKHASDYLNALKRDGIVDQAYFDKAMGWLNSFKESGDINSIRQAEKTMKGLRDESARTSNES